jgi:hypothetical protein
LVEKTPANNPSQNGSGVQKDGAVSNDGLCEALESYVLPKRHDLVYEDKT